MRIILMGTGPFAVPMARAIYDSAHEVPLLVTRPQRVLHGKSQADANPMRELATAHGTPVFDPESINTDEARAELARHQPDLLVVCDYGQILKPETLAVARFGGINLHGSLLPRYRGAAPINWAIYHGEPELGVTVIHMTPRIDAGPAISQARLTLANDDTAVTVEPRLAELGAPLVLAAIEAIATGKLHPIPQDPYLASKAPRLKKDDGAVDWTRSAEQIRNQVRAFVPWPKTFTFWHRATGEPLRVILETVTVDRSASGTPGTVLDASGDRLLIATGNCGLQIEALQPSGKRVLSASEFLRGYPVRKGDCFGTADAVPRPASTG
jgi:methionyl-tRNA formyltransferase